MRSRLWMYYDELKDGSIIPDGYRACAVWLPNRGRFQVDGLMYRSIRLRWQSLPCEIIH